VVFTRIGDLVVEVMREAELMRAARIAASLNEKKAGATCEAPASGEEGDNRVRRAGGNPPSDEPTRANPRVPTLIRCMNRAIPTRMPRAALFIHLITVDGERVHASSSSAYSFGS
jgi:hypothetical protein